MKIDLAKNPEFTPFTIQITFETAYAAKEFANTLQNSDTDGLVGADFDKLANLIISKINGTEDGSLPRKAN